MRLLVTRPQPGAARTETRLKSMGHDTHVLSLFEPEHFPEIAVKALQSPVSALIVTSSEVFRALATVRAALAPIFHLPLFAVGSSTQKAAEEFGFTNVMAGTEGGRELGLKISAMAKSNPAIASSMLYLAGTPRSSNLEETLAEENLKCATEIVYAMRALPISFGEIAAKLDQVKPDAILFYSAETAKQFFKLATDNGRYNILQNTRLLCLSRNIAAVVPQSLEKYVEISDRPDEDSLMDLLSQV